MSVVYRIDKATVSRTRSVTLNSHRPELKELTEGRLDAPAFIDLVAGRLGLVSPTGKGCLVGQGGSRQPDVEIGDRATVMVADEFPDYITNANGFADRPVLSLCFLDGLPVLGDTGHLEIRIADYKVIATSPRPATIAIEQSETGVVERVYGWDQIRRQGPSGWSWLST